MICPSDPCLMSDQQTAIPLTALDVPTDVDPRMNQSTTPEQAAEKSSAKLVEGLKWAVSFPAMLGMFLIGRVFYEARGFVVDPDIWWHIKVGHDILRTHHW